ncbi:NADP-dependent oxidoreductase domain-containing protein [Mycena crocata]|nr:NADP-dependent oxidoreductase domain-containing protein [Mycena crocata]
MATQPVSVIFGAMTIGEPGREGVRIITPEEIIELFDVFQKHGHSEVDTARVYGAGTSEEKLGAVDWQERGIKMETKFYPTKGKGLGWLYPDELTHSPADLRKALNGSLAALKTGKLHIFYLHGPDRTTPFEDTLREVNKIYTDGVFERFGLSNFQSWEVARIWLVPRAASTRRGRTRSMPARLWNKPLRICYARDHTFNDGERFDPGSILGQIHRMSYWNEPNFKALDLLRPAIAPHDITESEAALRWLAHHSALRKEFGDAVIVGVSSKKHLEENLEALDKGPLPADVVEALDAGWEHTRALPLSYWH